MRKIIESTLISVDGVIENPQDWALKYFDESTWANALQVLLASDALLMGRYTYEIFAHLFPMRTDDYAARLNGMRKYVFSSTLKETEWNNSVLVRGDAAAEIAKLKRQEGQDLLVYGHGALGRTLLEHDLLDELRFQIQPVIVGHGRLAFQENEKADLKLLATRTAATGIVTLYYQPISR